MRDRISFSSSSPDGADRPHIGRLAAIAFAMLVLTLALATATANASLLSPVGSFGSSGAGIAIQQTSGNVYVVGNARIDEYGPAGNFIRAFGWGVADGMAQAEVCTSNCQAGIAGSGPGQLSDPYRIAVGGPGSASAGKVFVGDCAPNGASSCAGNNRVEEFDADGQFIGAIDGTSTPQGPFQTLAGVSVDQSGNLWTVDASTDNVDEFNSHGEFVQQWTDTHASPGEPEDIAVDSTRDAVYVMSSPNLSTTFLTTVAPVTGRFTLTGQWKGEIDRAVCLGSDGFICTSASALAVDPNTGNLYVDHEGPETDVRVYDHNGTPLDDFSFPSPNRSEGIAFRSSGPGNPTGKGDVYLSDGNADGNVVVYAPQRTAGAPLVTSESGTGTGKTTATLSAAIVPLGHDTSCSFQYVDYASFNATGYTNAASVPCTPADLGSGFTYQAASANLSGLTTGKVYHFRVVATSSAGTTTGADQEFQAGPGDWAPFYRCPVDDPAMLANIAPTSPTLSSGQFCVAANSTHGSITLGKITTTTGNTNLQIGTVIVNGTFNVIPASGDSLVVDPVQLSTPVGPVTAVTESAGTPSNFSLFAGLSTGSPIITLPIKIRLENNSVLGPNCSIGSDQNPIVLNPQNTDLSNALAVGGLFSFDAHGVLDPAGPDGAIEITGAVQGDNTFAVPGATGCGANGSLDAAVDAVAGVPSPSGSNQLVLDDASSAAGWPFQSENGQTYASDWHTAFG